MQVLDFPPDLSPGVVPVTVTVAGQTSNPVNFTVTGGGGGTQPTVLDHRVTGDQLGPNAPCVPPPTPKSTFAPTDPFVFQWTFISGFQNGAMIRWEWIQPDGSIFKQLQGPVVNPNSEVCVNDAIDIAGQPAASLPGNWQVRVFYNGTLIATDNFTISGGGATQPTVLDHRVTGDELGPEAPCNPPPTPKSTFAPADPFVFQWTFISGFQNGAMIRWEWIQPDGTIFKRLEGPINNPNSEICFNDAIAIAGQPAASLPGNWQVRVFYNGSLLVTDNFTITGGAGGGPQSLCRLELSNLFGAGQALGAVWAVPACPSQPDPLSATTASSLQTTLQNVLKALDLIRCIRFDRTRVTSLSARFPGMPRQQAIQEVGQLIEGEGITFREASTPGPKNQP